MNKYAKHNTSHPSFFNEELWTEDVKPNDNLKKIAKKFREMYDDNGNCGCCSHPPVDGPSFDHITAILGKENSTQSKDEFVFTLSASEMELVLDIQKKRLSELTKELRDVKSELAAKDLLLKAYKDSEKMYEAFINVFNDNTDRMQANYESMVSALKEQISLLTERTKEAFSDGYAAGKKAGETDGFRKGTEWKDSFGPVHPTDNTKPWWENVKDLKVTCDNPFIKTSSSVAGGENVLKMSSSSDPCPPTLEQAQQETLIDTSGFVSTGPHPAQPVRKVVRKKSSVPRTSNWQV